MAVLDSKPQAPCSPYLPWSRVTSICPYISPFTWQLRTKLRSLSAEPSSPQPLGQWFRSLLLQTWMIPVSSSHTHQNVPGHRASEELQPILTTCPLPPAVRQTLGLTDASLPHAHDLSQPWSCHCSNWSPLGWESKEDSRACF